MSFCNTIVLQLLPAPSPWCVLATVVIFFPFKNFFWIKYLQVLSKRVHSSAVWVNIRVRWHAEHADIFQEKHGNTSVKILYFFVLTLIVFVLRTQNFFFTFSLPPNSRFQLQDSSTSPFPLPPPQLPLLPPLHLSPSFPSGVYSRTHTL